MSGKKKQPTEIFSYLLPFASSAIFSFSDWIARKLKSTSKAYLEIVKLRKMQITIGRAIATVIEIIFSLNEWAIRRWIENMLKLLLIVLICGGGKRDVVKIVRDATEDQVSS